MVVLTHTIYTNISRALFNQHKKIFSFIIACRISKISKIQYDYCIKGNFALPKEQKDQNKDGKETKEVMKLIAGLDSESNISLWNLRKVFPNTLHEHFSKDKERLGLFNENALKYAES